MREKVARQRELAAAMADVVAYARARLVEAERRGDVRQGAEMAITRAGGVWREGQYSLTRRRGRGVVGWIAGGSQGIGKARGRGRNDRRPSMGGSSGSLSHPESVNVDQRGRNRGAASGSVGVSVGGGGSSSSLPPPPSPHLPLAGTIRGVRKEIQKLRRGSARASRWMARAWARYVAVTERGVT